ncbi:MAG: FecR domain-containing protein [Candidatus Omnitrophica bacterium]|nr:FecR domain-containing protein [Candidatus Omnitrophota bacterium]
MKDIKKILLVSTIGLGMLVFLGNIFAAEMSKDLFISELYGNVMIKKSGAKEFIPAKKNMPVSLGDEIKTGKNAYCEIAFDKELETLVSVKENSDLVISKIMMESKTKKEETLLDLKSGSVLTKVKKLTTEESKFQIKTPTSIVGVRGTNFEVKVVQ